MEKCKFEARALIIDVFDYMFVEWLCRRRLYSKFVANLSSIKDNPMASRAAVREIIVHTLDAPNLALSDAVISAFAFESTSEGLIFWLNVSRDWKNFVESLIHLI